MIQIEDAYDRLCRWSKALPLDEPLPVGKGELYTFATRVAATFMFRVPGTVPTLVDQNRKSNFRFNGHKVIIL